MADKNRRKGKKQNRAKSAFDTQFVDEDLINELQSFDEDVISKKLGSQDVFFLGDDETPYKGSYEAANDSINIELLEQQKRKGKVGKTRQNDQLDVTKKKQRARIAAPEFNDREQLDQTRQPEEETFVANGEETIFEIQKDPYNGDYQKDDLPF